MKKPVIMAVDDERGVLAAVGRDLRRRYKNDYQVLEADSGTAALTASRELKQRGTPIALFVVDQRMPVMTGTQFLRDVAQLHPDARKVLLTAYADSQAAIDSINLVGLDHYLMKPWDPPEDRLYPVLDDLLASWKTQVRLPYQGIRVAGARWSNQCYQAKEFLSRNHIPYQWIDIDQDSATHDLVARITGGDLTRLPAILFPDGSALVAPTNRELADKIGMGTRAKHPFYDLVIIGGGPAGLANAVYSASEGLKTLLIELHSMGGQAGTTSRIENYLGFPSGLSGADLAHRATTQARRFGAEMLTAQEVVSVRREDPYRIVRMTDGSEVSCYAALLATGMLVRKLDVPGIDPLVGKGVYYGAAMTEAAMYRDADVCVVGGANSAGQGALFIARHARRVRIVLRARDLSVRMSQYLIDRIAATPNIEVLPRTEVTGLGGGDRLETISLRHLDTCEESQTETSALFIFVGTAPRSGMVAGLVEQDEKGFILTGPDLPRENNRVRGWPLDRDPFLFETSVPGIFAAGDVRAGANRRVAAAVGEGSAATYSIHRYLETV